MYIRTKQADRPGLTLNNLGQCNVWWSRVPAAEGFEKRLRKHC